MKDERPDYAVVVEEPPVEEEEEKAQENIPQAEKTEPAREFTEAQKDQLIDTFISLAGSLIGMIRKIPDTKMDEFRTKYHDLTFPLLKLIDFGSAVDLSFVQSKRAKQLLGGGILLGSGFLVHVDSPHVENMAKEAPHNYANTANMPPQKEENVGKVEGQQPEPQADESKEG